MYFSYFPYFLSKYGILHINRYHSKLLDRIYKSQSSIGGGGGGGGPSSSGGGGGGLQKKKKRKKEMSNF